MELLRKIALKICLVLVLAVIPATFSLAEILAQQSFVVRGKVSDMSNEPVSSVTVQVKGTSIGTFTNNDGIYTIEIRDTPEPVLVFSFVGMKTIEEPVNGRSVIDITMDEDLIGLAEVVMVGYATTKKADIVGAVSMVKTDEIASKPVGSLTQSLTGTIPGLIIRDEGGVPGSTAGTFQIRRLGSPLVIVDGMEQSFSYMDPNEIESITVLKDASAAIYGARAGNGVILVTTRRGSEKKQEFNVSATQTMSRPTVFPELADAATYATLKNEGNLSAGLAPRYTEEEIEKFRDGSDPMYPNTDMWSETFKKWALMTDLNINSSGGNKAASYFVSAGVKDQGTSLRSGSITFRRISLRSNLDVNITKRLKATLDLSGRFEDRNEPGLDFAALMSGMYASLPVYPVKYPDKTIVPYTGLNAYNPYYSSQTAFSGYNTDKFKMFRGTFGLNYNFNDFIKGLSADFRFDYKIYDTFLKTFKKPFTTYYYSYDYDTQEYSYQPSSIVFNGGKTTLNESYSRDWDWLLNYKLLYQRDFGRHNVGGLVLYEALSGRHDVFTAYREGFISPVIDQIFAGSDIGKDNSGSASESGRHSVVGRFNYSYAEKYLAEFIFRYDASPKFAEDYRWGFFPGVSIGWRISEEEFIKSSLPVVSNLKLKASYGQTGLEGSVNFNYLSGYEFTGNYIFDAGNTLAPGLATTGLANEAATWATSTIYNAGLEGSLFKDKLFFEVNGFYNIREGILATRQAAIPNTFGAKLPQENLNSFDTRGFELELGYRNVIGKLFYTITGNASWARSKWIHIEEPDYSTPEEQYRYQQTGRWTNVTYGLLTDGLFSSQEEIDGWADITNGANNNVIMVGDIKFLDLNDDGVIDWKDERVIGKNELPEANFSLNINLAYRGFELNTLITGAAGFSKYYGGQTMVPFGTDLRCFSFWEDAWTTTNPDPNAPYPRIRNGAQNSHPNTSNSSDFWTIGNAWFTRLKNVQLAYNFGRINKLDIQNMRVYVQAYNYGLLTNVRNLDPENLATAARYYPQQKSISFGIDVKF